MKSKLSNLEMHLAAAAFELAQDLWSQYDQNHRKQYELLPANEWIYWIQIPDLRDQAAAVQQTACSLEVISSASIDPSAADSYRVKLPRATIVAQSHVVCRC